MPQMFEVDRIVDCRIEVDHIVEYRVRWKGWDAADDTWEAAARLETEVPHAVRFFATIQGAALTAARQQKRRRSKSSSCRGRRKRDWASTGLQVVIGRNPSYRQQHPQNKLKSCLSDQNTADVRGIQHAQWLAAAKAAALAKLPSKDHRGLFQLMHLNFPATPPCDVAQIILECCCCLIIRDERTGHIGAGAVASIDEKSGRGFLHFLAARQRGARHGTALMRAVALEIQRAQQQLSASTSTGVLELDSQIPDDDPTANDPVSFYLACGCEEDSRTTVHPLGAVVPMTGRVDDILHRCNAKLQGTEHNIVSLCGRREFKFGDLSGQEEHGFKRRKKPQQLPLQGQKPTVTAGSVRCMACNGRHRAHTCGRQRQLRLLRQQQKERNEP